MRVLGMVEAGGEMDRFRGVLEVGRYGVFIGFGVLSIRMIFVTLTHSPPIVALVVGMSILAIGLLTWWRVKWALYGFAVGVPVVSGFQFIGFMKLFPLLSTGFAGIFLVWFGKRLIWDRKSIFPVTQVGNLVDVISAVVLLSLIMQLLLFPFDFIVY